ncbi:nucleotidyl transferase AbiEii/AbiGii toxin family protein [Cellulomonas sp.]
MPAGRTTKDVDLLAQARDLPTAVADLRRLAVVDLGDHFRFVPVSERESIGGTSQPHVTTRRVAFDAFCGTRRALPSFGVDVVVGSLMTGVPDKSVDDPIPLRGLTPPVVRLYPLVDHIADKLCERMTTYASGASSRERDLVDLVVFALTQDVDGAGLTTAIHGEWTNRELGGLPQFEPPAAWRSRFATLARKTPACTIVTFDEAVELVTRFLTPPMDRSAGHLRWTMADRAWRPLAGREPTDSAPYGMP